MGESKCWIPGLLLCTVLFLQIGDTKLVPDFIHPCREDDHSGCLLKSAREALPDFVKGLPELGVPVLDPFMIERIAIPLPGLKIAFYDGKLTGFKKCIIDRAETNLPKHRMIMDVRCNVTLKGKYEAVGRVLLFPINGEGDAKVKITNLKMKMNLHFKYIKDDKQLVHYALDNYKYNFDYGDKMSFNLTNIIKGQPELSSTILQFLNENWRQVADEFGKPIVDYSVELVVRTIEKFFLSVPYNELVDGPVHLYE